MVGVWEEHALQLLVNRYGGWNLLKMSQMLCTKSNTSLVCAYHLVVFKESLIGGLVWWFQPLLWAEDNLIQRLFSSVWLVTAIAHSWKVSISFVTVYSLHLRYFLINSLTINALFVGHSLSMFEQQIGLWSVDLQTFTNINRKIVFRKSSTIH